MNSLKAVIKNHAIKLIIWDFDKVLFKLNWSYQGSSAELLEDMYRVISEIDGSIIRDKDEFIARLFPYPEINEVGIRHGKEAQAQVKALFAKKELAALHLAVPNQELISFVKMSDLAQSIWSNNMSLTIERLLEKFDISSQIDVISSLDKVICSKPDVEGFKMIKDNYPEINLENILFVGDSLISDKAAADNVGVRFWHYRGEGLR